MADEPEQKLKIPLPFEEAIKAALEVDPKKLPPHKEPEESEEDRETSED